MNYLLDTHIFLWILGAPDRIRPEVRKAIRDPRHTVYVSAVSSVEIAIKQALGKLEVPAGLEDEIETRGFQLLPLHFRHGARMSALPGHHQDPFDRMLLAQAMDEGLTLITHDRKMENYPVKLLLT